MRRALLITGGVGVALTGLALVSSIGGKQPPPSAIVVVSAPTAAPIRRITTSEPILTVQLPPPSTADRAEERDPTQLAPGATNYADLGVLPAL